eukprot:4256721-Heterocapsa_arctica.AAC.1
MPHATRNTQHAARREGVFSKKEVKQIKNSGIGKDRKHFMQHEDMKGGKEEFDVKFQELMDNSNVEYLPEEVKARKIKKKLEKQIYHPNIITYDFECDGNNETKAHKSKHVDVDVLVVDDTHSYQESLQMFLSWSGYADEQTEKGGAVNDSCNWLFTEDNTNATDIAHNQAGYDGRFALKWCLERGLKPTKFIRQGNRIMHMTFAELKIRFVDSPHFFLGRLKKLSSTYKMDTLKGYFPHFFNTSEKPNYVGSILDQNYVGSIPDESMYGAEHMDADEYQK